MQRLKREDRGNRITRKEKKKKGLCKCISGLPVSKNWCL